MAGMTNNHRYFVQYMLKNGIKSIDNAQEYCKHVSRGEIENITQLKTLVIEINREISKQYYKLAFIVCEVTNQKSLVWLNTKNDDLSKMQIKYSALELEYFHAILQEILHNEEHRITYIICINITSTLTSFFSRENGQKMLKMLIKNGYFVGKGPYIYLGPRLILEFTSYLKTHLPESICNLCSELVFWGKVCNSCQKKLHSHCLKKYLENQNNCPNCQMLWSSPMEEEEEDEESNIDTSQDSQYSEITSITNTGSQSIIENGRNKIVKTRRQIPRDDDEDDIDEDPDKPGPSTRKRHR